MANSLTELIKQKITFILVIGGLVLIIVASTFHLEFFKVKIDHVMAEVGALFLIVGTLHWMFESLLREEMIKDITTTALGSSRIHDSGLVDCVLNSKKVAEDSLWKASQHLIISAHYSARFFEQIHEILKHRCATNKETKIYLVKSESPATEYLVKSESGFGDVEANIKRIERLVETCEPKLSQIQLLYHDRVLRYTFIYTEQSIWIKLFTNSKIRTNVPAFKVQSGTPLYEFFETDIFKFMEQNP